MMHCCYYCCECGPKKFQSMVRAQDPPRSGACSALLEPASKNEKKNIFSLPYKDQFTESASNNFALENMCIK